MRNMFDIEITLPLNLRRYKLYSDMHLNEYIFAF